MINKLTNFREIKIGCISKGVLYRSNHPIYNGNIVENIILKANKANIKTILNLSDNIMFLKSKVKICPWYENLINNNNVIALNINMKFNIMENNFTKKIKQCILFIINHESPYLIHCEAGIDRTGFLSILLEAFMEARFEEIVKDYMLSFVDKNDYKEGEIFIKNIFGTMKGNLINTNENIKDLVDNYLKSKIGINENELNILRNKLMNIDI